MHIVFYRSFLCPRCHLARRHLHELAGQIPELSIEEIDIMQSPRRVWRDGIRMIPAMRSGDTILSGITLSRKKIAAFIDENLP